MRLKRILFLTQIVLGFVLAGLVLRNCSRTDYNWSNKMIQIKGTIKQKPFISRGSRSGSDLNIEINELPLKLRSPGYEYYDFLRKDIVDHLFINDSITFIILEYDYRNYLKRKEKNPDIKYSIDFYGLSKLNKQYVDNKALDVERPNDLAVFLLLFSFCSILIITGFLNLTDTLK